MSQITHAPLFPFIKNKLNSKILKSLFVEIHNFIRIKSEFFMKTGMFYKMYFCTNAVGLIRTP